MSNTLLPSAFVPFLCAVLLVGIPGFSCGAEPIPLRLQYQTETKPDSHRFHRLVKHELWKPEETAIVVCDVWDLHHCLNAVRRVQQLAPRLNELLADARARGITVIHAPSDCMAAYEKHPARLRALATPVAQNQPPDIKSWCSLIPAEERGIYPIDQSDGGEDDDPTEHAEWAAQLQALGRNPQAPWKSQTDLLTINEYHDYISDQGDEVWNILQDRGIKNVILSGVHTNMCVLGRPFGLRQLARNGKHVVLLRDLTDTMYNPKRWPYVSHFTGTDLIIDHIERFVCPTITSDQFLGGQPLRFRGDTRPHIALMIAEDEYRTEETLPKFVEEQLRNDFRVSLLFGSETERHAIPGMHLLDEADLLLVSVRRRGLPTADLDVVRRFAASGKPVIGIRTASHAFSLRDPAPAGIATWPEFDAQVFGGNYHGHLGDELTSMITQTDSPEPHPILQGVPGEPFPQGGSLYQTSPLTPGTTVLLSGLAEGNAAEPVAWTYTRNNGGRSFYTSLGNVDDFARPEFVRLLKNAIYWSCELPIPQQETEANKHAAISKDHWDVVVVPDQMAPPFPPLPRGSHPMRWYRAIVRVPGSWVENNQALTLTVPAPRGVQVRAWLNGSELRDLTATPDAAVRSLSAAAEFASPDDANLLVVRLSGDLAQARLIDAPELSSEIDESLILAGRWQSRVGDNPSWSNIPLPSKFGGSADIFFEPPGPRFVARPLTRPGQFTGGIEGPACDRFGNILAVNYEREGTIGRVRPDGVGEVFVTLPEGSIGNGICVGRNGDLFVADYTRHNILRIDPTTGEVSTLCHNVAMNQPNDLAIGPDGTLYASDPNWSDGTGQLWRIDADGTSTLLADGLGTTNGIEVSPDGRTLYVNESVQRNIWAFSITPSRQLGAKRLVRQFDDFGMDGMRCDIDGHLYVTRHGKGTVVKLSPYGEIIEEIDVLGTRPSNLCFGGPDGCTVYVTEVDFTRLVAFRVDRPGLAWSRDTESK